MKTAPQYATRTFTIAAGGSVEVIRQASFVTVLESDAEFKARFDNAPEFDLEQGLTIRAPELFSRMEFRNPGAAPIVVKVGLGKGDVNDARLTISGQVTTQEAAPNSLTTGSPLSATNAATTLIAAENLLRREIIIANDGAGKVYIGTASGATAGQGLPLDAGQTMVLANTAAIYARNDSGAAVNVCVSEAA